MHMHKYKTLSVKFRKDFSISACKAVFWGEETVEGSVTLFYWQRTESQRAELNSLRIPHAA